MNRLCIIVVSVLLAMMSLTPGCAGRKDQPAAPSAKRAGSGDWTVGKTMGVQG